MRGVVELSRLKLPAVALYSQRSFSATGAEPPTPGVTPPNRRPDPPNVAILWPVRATGLTVGVESCCHVPPVWPVTGGSPSNPRPNQRGPDQRRHCRTHRTIPAMLLRASHHRSSSSA